MLYLALSWAVKRRWTLLLPMILAIQLAPALCNRALRVSTNYGSHGEVHCRIKNPKLAAFLKQAESTPDMLLPKSRNYPEFLKEMKESLDAHMLPDRVIHHLFSNRSAIYPYCDGDWMEFGVAYGATINLMANWRAKYCGKCPFVHGFDTFTGLPETWKRDDHSDYKPGSFDLEGNLPGVGPNVNLVKGLFNESLPLFLRKQAAYGAADSPMTVLHIDCDLYRGAADVFSLVAHKIVPGTIIVFDDLVNYQYYAEGEMKAWWEYLQASGAKFATIGMLGPLPGKDYAMEASMPDGAHEWFAQSAAFVIISIPGKVNPFDRQVLPDTKSASVQPVHPKRGPVVTSTLEVLDARAD